MENFMKYVLVIPETHEMLDDENGAVILFDSKEDAEIAIDTLRELGDPRADKFKINFKL